MSAIGVTAYVQQVMMDELETFRSAKEMDPAVRKAAISLVRAHLQNLSQVGMALSNSVYDPIDPEGIYLPSLN